MPTNRGKFVEIRFAPDLATVREAARETRAFLEAEGVPPDQVEAWELVVTEAGNNAVRYAEPGAAQADLRLCVQVGTGEVEVRLEDRTAGFELPARYELPDSDSEGGRGLFLMHSLTDSLDYLRSRQGNCIVLRRRFARDGAPPVAKQGEPCAGELEATLQTMTEELAASYESLSAIFRFTEDLARGGVTPDFAGRWLGELRSITGADWIVLRLTEPEESCLRAFQTVPPDLDLPPLPLVTASTPGLPVETCATIDKTDVWFDHRRPLAAADPLGLLGAGLSGFSHPMFVSGELMGVLTIGYRGEERTFSAGQVSIVQTLSDFLAIQVRDSRYEQARLQSRLLQRDFEVASDIQRRLLPKDHPIVGDWIAQGYCQSSRRVGGDFYDVIQIGSHGMLLAIADVMGKGLPAALFATVFRTLLHARRDLADRPGEFLEWLNRELSRDLGELEMFITAQLAYVDLARRTVRLAGAGHPPLLVAGHGTPAFEIPSAGPPLGILAGLTFAESETALPERARILMYTDGLTELVDRAGDQVGMAPLRRILDESVAGNLDSLRTHDRIAGLQAELGADQVPNDDQTFVLLFEESA